MKKSKIYFTPGPSQLYPTVAKHIFQALRENIPSISHRGEKFHSIFQNTTRALRTVLKIPKEYQIFFLSSGTEAMERIIENTVEKYSTHFVNGAFSQRFWQTAQELYKKPYKIGTTFGTGFNFASIEVPKKTEVFCFTHNETSTGVALSMHDIYNFKKQYKDTLIAVDTVSSAPYIDIDYSMVDLVFFSVQKGFGLPAGLAVLIVSPSALEKYTYLTRKKVSTGSYHSFDSLIHYLEKSETPETPNVFGIYLLGKVCEDLLKKGIELIRKETEEKADILYKFFEERNGFDLFVKDPKQRSKTVIVIQMMHDSSQLIEELKKRGLIVGMGYKEYKTKHIRIANFPSHSMSDIKKLVREIKIVS